MPDRLLTVGAAAAMLMISPSAVRDAIHRGQLPAVRTAGGHRRVRLEDVEMLRRSLRPLQPEPRERPRRSF